MTDQTQTPQPGKSPSVGGPADYQQVSGEQRAIWRAKGHRYIGFGIVWLVAGIIITAFTYEQASQAGGGVYLVAYGPVLYGIYRIIRGIVLLQKS